MTINECWLCDGELTITKEHVIPASMGGTKTVIGFICRDCNSKTGHSWDSAVAEFESWQFQLNSKLQVNPRKGKTMRAKMADSGLNAIVEPGARVKLGFNAPTTIAEEDGRITYQFTGDPSQVDTLFDSANTLLRRKGVAPLTREEFDSGNEYHVTTNPAVTFRVVLRIPAYSRSLVKTAMAMAFSVGVNPRDCVNAIPYLKNEALDEEGVVTLFSTSLEGFLGDWTDYHAVNIFSLTSDRKLLAEVLYFGKLAGLVTLSDSYEGPWVIAGHSINLRTGKVLDGALNLSDFYVRSNQAARSLQSKIGQFKSPMLLPAFQGLGPPYLSDSQN